MEPIVFHITQRGPIVPFILFSCKNNLGYGAARNRGAMSKVKAPRPLHAEQRLSTSKGGALCCRPLKSLPVQTQMSCIVRKDVWQFRLETNFTFHMQSQHVFMGCVCGKVRRALLWVPAVVALFCPPGGGPEGAISGDLAENTVT